MTQTLVLWIVRGFSLEVPSFTLEAGDLLNQRTRSLVARSNTTARPSAQRQKNLLRWHLAVSVQNEI
ncbi:MAG: hypothetical protein PW735_12325 [Acidobacteriaceae bacterium]|nr:hypothetical protein [Acidobacteriaceae bacterium]